MIADPFTRASPTFGQAYVKRANHLPLAAFEVAESGHRSSWWLVLVGAALVAAALWGLS